MDVAQFKLQIVEKTDFSLKIYEKYRQNLIKKKEILKFGDFFDWGNERELLIKEIPELEFYRFVERFLIILEEIVEDIGDI